MAPDAGSSPGAVCLGDALNLHRRANELGTRQSIIKVCHEILAEFGYPKESFEIQMNGD